MIDDLVCFFWTVRYAASEGDHGDEIVEGLSAFAVVDDTGLALLVRRERFFQMRHGIWCDEATLLTLLYVSIGGLQEATIATENLMLSITCEAIEGGGSVDDGTVVATNIDDSKGARTVDGAEDDDWVGTGDYAREEGEEIETRGGVNRKT